MKKLACKDLNLETTCDYVAFGETEDEAVDGMITHAKAEHADDLAEDNLSDEALREWMTSKVHE